MFAKGEVTPPCDRLAEAGVGMLLIPTMFLPRDGARTLDRFIGEIAPALR